MSHSRLSSAKLLSALSAGFAAVILLGSCGGNQNVSSRFAPHPSKPGNPGTNPSTKPLPALGTPDRHMLVLEELTRIQLTLRNMQNPKTHTEGCVKYQASGAKQGVILIASYNNCGWKQVLSTDKTGVIFGLRGIETYQSYAPRKLENGRTQEAYTEATVPFKVAVARASSPRKAVAMSSFSHRVRMTPSASQTNTVELEATWGAENESKADYWIADLVNGGWKMSGQDPVMADGTDLHWKYRPGVIGKTPAAFFEMHLTAAGDVSFSSQCPWPIKGSFNWTEVDQANNLTSGQITVDEQGFTDGTTRVSWPKDHCLEKK